jgi:hypothetical protein
MHSVTFGVIDEARGHRRRRIAIVAVLAAGVGIALGLALSRIGGPGTHSPTFRAPSRVAPAAVFSQAPRMGVACHLGACNSVGVAVWLRTPAVSVSARVAGHPFPLTTWDAPRQLPRKMFVGFITPIRLVTSLRLVHGPPADWPTASSPRPLVLLRVTYGNGRVVEARLRVPVEPGWG